MNIITLFGKGLHIDYWKSDIHPYFTKDMTGIKPKIKHLRITLCKWTWEKVWTPTYKIIVKWEHNCIDTYKLRYFLDNFKNVKWSLDYDNKTIVVLFKGGDHIRNTLEDVIRDIGYYLEPEYEGDQKHYQYKTSVELA